MLEGLLFVITLGVGWLIWVVFFTAKHGQTPAKQILHMRVMTTQSHQVAGWGTMFLRDVIYKWVIGLLVAGFTFGIGYLVLMGWILVDKNSQQLWDKMGATIVVDDPSELLVYG